jgi:hypothetical protein
MPSIDELVKRFIGITEDGGMYVSEAAALRSMLEQNDVYDHERRTTGMTVEKCLERPGMTVEQWLGRFCDEHDLQWEALSKGQQFQLMMRVPCTIRCFRIGGAVDPMRVGDRCPECGRPHEEDPFEPKTFWERLDSPPV